MTHNPHGITRPITLSYYSMNCGIKSINAIMYHNTYGNKPLYMTMILSIKLLPSTENKLDRIK